MPLKGAKAHVQRLKFLSSPAALDYLGKALFFAGNTVEAEVALSMVRGRAEVVDKKNHIPSKPGEPPAVYDGDLRRGLETTQPEPLVVIVASNDRKAALLEFGTSKMAERPYMRPARDKTKAEVVKILSTAMDRMVKASRSNQKD